jgi:hypothetical protein
LFTLVSMELSTRLVDSSTFPVVDDGTLVVDCFHRHAQVPQNITPKKNKPNATLVQAQEPPQTPVPVADVGCLVAVVGKVANWHEGRQINVTQIGALLASDMEPFYIAKSTMSHCF